jgi:POT family proton-dependent oligopeptide transporter
VADPSNRSLQAPAIKRPRPAFYGVALVAFAELWERASYYSLVALIALFAIATIKDGGLGLTNSEAILISGDYTLMAFGLPVIFGFLGDRLIGHYRAVVLGAMVIVSGHATLFFGDHTNITTFWVALWLVASGTGLLKPAMPCLVSSFYGQNRMRRDRAFKYYYMMINIGGMIGPLVAGLIQVKWGFDWAFLWAGLGMTVALIVLILARPLVPATERGRPGFECDGIPEPPDPIALDRHRFRINTTMLSVLFLLFMVWALAYGVFAGSATSELIGNSYVDRDILGWTLPAAAMNSIEPAIIVIATPILAILLTWLARRGKFPHSVLQMVIGGLLSCVAVIMLGWLATRIPLNVASAPVIGLGVFVGAYAFISIGEVLISPVYMAVITRLAPRRQQATWQGAVLLAIGILGFATSRIGAYAESDGGVHRAKTFIVTGIVAFMIVVLFSFLTPFLIRTIQRHNPTPDDTNAELKDELEAMKQLDASEPAIGVRVEKTEDH